MSEAAVAFQEVFRHEIPMRWGDMDAFGHVNNTLYFRYMEQTRTEWMESCGVLLDGKTGPVIVNAHMNFLKQVRYPARLRCTLLVQAPGRSSFETRFELHRLEPIGSSGSSLKNNPENDPARTPAEATAVLVANGGAKVVWVDYVAEKSMRLPDAVLQRLPTAP